MRLSDDEARLLKVPPVKWDEEFQKLDHACVGEISRQLCGTVVYLTRTALYFESRYLGRDHKAAVKASNEGVARVRKALGYTYPKDPLNF